MKTHGSDRSRVASTKRQLHRYCVRVSVFCVFAWVSTACLVFSDFEHSETDASSSTRPAASDVPRPSDACEVGTFSCVLDELRTCVDGRWTVLQECASGDHCSTRLGACLHCEPGAEHRCDDGKLQRCAETGMEFTTIVDCELQHEVCDTSVSVETCVDCAVPHRRCSDGALQRCVNGRFDAGVPCTVGDCRIVDGSNDYCPQCLEPGQEACGADERVRCGEDLRWEQLEQCPLGCVFDDGTTRCL